MKNHFTNESQGKSIRYDFSTLRKPKTFGFEDSLGRSQTSSVNGSMRASTHKPILINQDLVKLIQENQQLKIEVRRLRATIYQWEQKQKQVNGFQQKDLSVPWEETRKLKIVIEKSYYSIRQMEKEIDSLNDELKLRKKECQKLAKDARIYDQYKQKLEQKIIKMESQHHFEIGILNNRICSLEQQIQNLARIFKQDQIQWNQNIENFKSFYPPFDHQ